MIIFHSDKFQMDVSAYGVSLNEESDLFSDNIHKKYSLPFTMTDPEVISQVALIRLENISGAETKITGRLVFPDRHFPATLFLGEITGKKIQATFTYGDADLA